jgi:hypothetical protein
LSVGLLRLPIIVTALTVLAFMADLNGFSMLTFAFGTKDIFGLALYSIPLINGLLSKSLFEK